MCACGLQPTVNCKTQCLAHYTISSIFHNNVAFYYSVHHFNSRQLNQRMSFEIMKTTLDRRKSVLKVDVRNLVTNLNQTPIFESCAVWYHSKNGYHKDTCQKEIGLHVQNMRTILMSIVNLVGTEIYWTILRGRELSL